MKSAAPPGTATTGGQPPENPEKHCHQGGWSGKRDSNPRPSAWKADALAAELFPLKPLFMNKMVEGGGFEPPKASPTDLQSVPFDRSGTPPRLREQGIALDAQALGPFGSRRPRSGRPLSIPTKRMDHC
jgi:hypothetical protein